MRIDEFSNSLLKQLNDFMTFHFYHTHTETRPFGIILFASLVCSLGSGSSISDCAMLEQFLLIGLGRVKFNIR